METELQELRDAVARLTTDNERLTQAGQTSGPVSDGAQGTSTSRTMNADATVNDDDEGDEYEEPPHRERVERVVYVPRDRKCPLFSGRGELTPREWIEEIKSVMHSRHMSTRDQAQFVYDHLIGEAKDEIKFRPKRTRDHPRQIFDILLEQFNNSKPLIVLKERFYARKQQEGESLREFSNSLFSLMDEMIHCCPNGVAGSTRLLTAQFIQYVRDGHLSRELKRIAREQPEYDLHDIRDEAIRWEREGRSWEGSSHSHSVPLAYSMQQEQARAVPSTTALELAELRAMLKEQQGQIQELTQAVRACQNPPRQPFAQRNPIICNRCQQPGHFSRDCDGERVRPQPQVQRSHPPSNGAGSRSTHQPSLN